jgi:hypothetical protein
MEDDLQLFLGSNTDEFTGWLHQVLQKLHEVTVASLGKIYLRYCVISSALGVAVGRSYPFNTK